MQIPTCSFCQRDLIGPIPSEDAVARFSKRTGISVEGRICNSCINRMQHGKTAAKAQFSRDAEEAYNSALRAIESDDYQTFAAFERSMNDQIETVERHIERALDQMRGFNQRREQFINFRDQALAALAKSPNASYFLRRAEADRAISDRELRLRIFRRDGFQCVYCKVTIELTVDHILSVKNGGSDEDENLQTLCRRCNSVKGVRSDNEIRAIKKSHCVPVGTS